MKYKMISISYTLPYDIDLSLGLDRLAVEKRGKKLRDESKMPFFSFSTSLFLLLWLREFNQRKRRRGELEVDDSATIRTSHFQSAFCVIRSRSNSLFIGGMEVGSCFGRETGDLCQELVTYGWPQIVLAAGYSGKLQREKTIR